MKGFICKILGHKASFVANYRSLLMGYKPDIKCERCGKIVGDDDVGFI